MNYCAVLVSLQERIGQRNIQACKRPAARSLCRERKAPAKDGQIRGLWCLCEGEEGEAGIKDLCQKEYILARLWRAILFRGEHEEGKTDDWCECDHIVEKTAQLPDFGSRPFFHLSVPSLMNKKVCPQFVKMLYFVVTMRTWLWCQEIFTHARLWGQILFWSSMEQCCDEWIYGLRLIRVTSWRRGYKIEYCDINQGMLACCDGNERMLASCDEKERRLACCDGKERRLACCDGKERRLASWDYKERMLACCDWK